MAFQQIDLRRVSRKYLKNKEKYFVTKLLRYKQTSKCVQLGDDKCSG